MSIAFQPQTNGHRERGNRILEDMLRHYVSPTQDDWDINFFWLSLHAIMFGKNQFKLLILC